MNFRSRGDRARYPRFEVGERVKMTKYAARYVGTGRARSSLGSVVAQDSRQHMLVVRDGIRSVESWYSGFWRHLRPGEQS